ncbi:MAG: hypothetical protein K8F91_08385 [Candidatus Obscuribacterales bacterium]|nr:hypothetical protein [Candidatus Obscuribacterales bacterium]
MSRTSRMAPWLAELMNLLNDGCSKSPFVRNLDQSESTLSTGKELCQTLWPFISSLPGNVKRVREKLPESMIYTKQLFDHLSDAEFYYQGLYLKQCLIAGVSRADLDNSIPDKNTTFLCLLMEDYCMKGDYMDGVMAIVTAELAATTFARHSYPQFERFFVANPPDKNIVTVEDGLAWLKLHAKPNLRHAMWMKQTVDHLPVDPPNKMPEQVETLLKAIHGFWRCSEVDKTKVEARTIDFQPEPKSSTQNQIQALAPEKQHCAT